MLEKTALAAFCLPWPGGLHGAVTAGGQKAASSLRWESSRPSGSGREQLERLQVGRAYKAQIASAREQAVSVGGPVSIQVGDAKQEGCRGVLAGLGSCFELPVRHSC